jgi:two-component system, OmpR family, sensor kinase
MASRLRLTEPMLKAPEHQRPGRGLEGLLWTLERLLQIPATELGSALDQAATLVGEALGAEKVDAWLRDPAIEVLSVIGINDSPMSRRERELGLDRLALADGGPIVEVYRTGASYCTGQADQDPLVRRGFWEGLGVRSMACVALEVGGEPRGVLLVSDARQDAFTDEDLRLLEAAARWVGLVAHRAELVEQIARHAAEQGRRTAAEELVTVLAHDLRNYLTPIRSRLELLERRAGREGQDRYAQDARSALVGLERLQRLIGDLLDVARLEQGLFTLRRMPTDLLALAQDAAAHFSTADTEVAVRASVDELRADIDPDRVRQALDNLLLNATKHSPPGLPVRVEVGTTHQADQELATITVSDQGPGIPPEVLPRLFTRFAAGGAAAGLGLGLYLAHAIATAHGGTLVAESLPGAGARFVLTLPVPGAPAG